MDGSRDNRKDDNFRKNFVFKMTGVSYDLQLRQRVLEEIGGVATYNNILRTAVQRCRNNANPSSRSLYGTWHQHISTIGKVFEEFRRILAQLQLSEEEKQNLSSQLNKEYGSGSDGNYLS